MSTEVNSFCISTILTPPHSPSTLQKYECSIFFKGYIHHYNYRSSNYKCFFQGPDAYTQIADLFGNPNWGRKFFDNNQQTFIRLFDARAEVEANQEVNFDSSGNEFQKID
ncbi:hypothetical protein Glove_117g70 [Diversispora epigaea]|uniref:Uncharacterized protein n=1 Tax=Diversispora epigaea TaxID=1348612 RepID=A0A397J382_9GLOM|nr:hypothetical protein Glove_117g70 [Diversispora epigaea]